MNRAGGGLLGLVVSSTASTFAQLCALWIAVLPIAAMAIYGWLHGIFLAILAGMQLLTSFLIALGLARPLASGLQGLGVPGSMSLGVAYGLVFVGCVVTVRLAVGAWVPEGVVRFSPSVDRFGGAAVGALSGAVLAGTILVGWSLAPLPAWVRLDTSHLPFDGGKSMLWTFARCAVPSGDIARDLFGGDPLASMGATGTEIRASEPFVDANGNGVFDGDGAGDSVSPERYLDLDADGAFTPVTRWIDHDGDGRGTIGLVDCYRLAEWRQVRRMNAPRLISSGTAEIKEDHAIDQPIYRAEATDIDATGTLSYHVQAVDDGEGVDVAIDTTTGDVTLLEPADYERKKRHAFVIEARDGRGLTDSKTIEVRVRDVPLY